MVTCCGAWARAAAILPSCSVGTISSSVFSLMVSPFDLVGVNRPIPHQIKQRYQLPTTWGQSDIISSNLAGFRLLQANGATHVYDSQPSRRAFASGASLAALAAPVVAFPTLAAGNASPDHELIVLGAQLRTPHAKTTAASDAFKARQIPMLDKAWDAACEAFPEENALRKGNGRAVLRNLEPARKSRSRAAALVCRGHRGLGARVRSDRAADFRATRSDPRRVGREGTAC
jgi:hypothetical protein